MKIKAIGEGTQVTFYGVRFLVLGPTWIALRSFPSAGYLDMRKA